MDATLAPATNPASTDPALLDAVTQYLYREARLCDEHEYDAWEALWTDDAIYWIPANGEGGDPEHVMSIVYDNRSRIALRVRQFHTGKRFSQTPRSNLRRLMSNVELLEVDDASVTVACNVMLFESTTRGDIVWGARNRYVLRREGDGFRMARKTVTLVNNSTALFSMAFLM